MRVSLRAIAAFMVILTVISLVPMTASAAAPLSGVYEGEGSFEWSLDKDTGVLTVECEGDMHDFGLYSYAPWYASRAYIRSVELSEGMKSIGDYAFYDCAKLTKIGFSSTLEGIGRYSFNKCTSLKAVDIPEGVTYIMAGAFLECFALSDISIPQSLRSLERDAFGFCPCDLSITRCWGRSGYRRELGHRRRYLDKYT